MKNLTLISFNRNSSNLVFYKSLLHVILLFIIITITYRVFLVSVLYFLQLVLEVLFEAFIVIYLLSRIMRRAIARDFKLNHIEIYLIILFFLPILPAIGAYQRFGQPIFYGLGTFRDFYLIFGSLVVYNMLRSGEITIQMVEKAFVSLTVFNMFFCYGLTFFTDPANFQDTGIAGANDLKGGEVYYRFNMSLFFFGSIYFVVKAFYQKNTKYLLWAGLFLIYIIFIRLDRTSMAGVFAGIGLFLATGIGTRSQFTSIFRLVLPLALVLVFAAIAVPEILDRYALMFNDAISTTTGSRNDYAEESVRLAEYNIAVEGIKDKPLIGNGKVSTQWVEGGYNAFYAFFYASDVGIFGQVFMYGFIGASILYGQFLFALFFAIKIRHIKRNIFLVTLKCFLFTHSLDSITNGYITIYAGQTIMAVVLIYYFYQEDRKLGAQLRMNRVISKTAIESAPKSLLLS